MKYIINENDYIVRKIDGETMMLNPLNGESHLLDNVATRFLEAIVQYEDKGHIIQSLMQYFHEVDEPTLSEDVDNFIESLIDKKILLKR